ncbi:MAG: 6-carboxytetrahydropterin synthase QueD [Kiritimatiellae bacterium]|nr:6-carboxytetrahydropterin synthase QueD [Kiritimatiellia bacterium]
MLTVSKECVFDAAHVLTNHIGQCKNLHGHTYRLIVEVAKSSESTDMVIDFTDLKRVMQGVILDRFDHAFIYDERSASESEIAAVITKHNMKSVGLPFRSTAENLARYFYQQLAAHVNVRSIKLYETPASCATYSQDR